MPLWMGGVTELYLVTPYTSCYAHCSSPRVYICKQFNFMFASLQPFVVIHSGQADLLEGVGVVISHLSSVMSSLICSI